MEYRKLIKFGNSSFIISVPSNWLKKNNLGKGDIVYLEEDGDSKLILFSEFNEKKEEKISLIDTNGKDMYRIKEEIYKSYTDGYNIIKVIGANLENFSESVRKIFNNFVAVEIIEQTQGKIIAKDFLNIEDVNVKDIIRRIDIILRSMFSDSFECMKKLKSSVISKRDVDVNRLCFMLERLLRSAMDNTEISRKLKINGSELLRFWSIAINLEKIGDEIKRISRFFNNVDFNTKQKKELSEIFFEIEKLYLDVMKSYYKNDLNLAFDVNYRKDGLQNKCTLFFEKNRVDGLCEKMKSLISWIREISLVVCK